MALGNQFRRAVLAAAGVIVFSPWAAADQFGAAESKIRTADRKIRAAADEFVLYYFRPDGRYDGWSLWMWNPGRDGGKRDFSGIQNGVAYLKDRIQPGADAFGFIVRTDTWAKDPGPDMFHALKDGRRWAVISGDPNVYRLDAAGRIAVAPPPPEPPMTPELSDSVRAMLPEPVIDAHPEWVDLYWAAWKFMHEKISAGNTANGFVPRYIDEGFNENIYQWDSCFMAAYAIHGLDVFPAMATLDNFYRLQRAADGYICRTYNENTGRATGEGDINPPLFAWMEWRYYKLSGDTGRIDRVLPALDRYFRWVEANARNSRGHGLYFITDLGSGMDNSPREEFIRKGAWIDLSSQQALAAICISRLAGAAGWEKLEAKYRAHFVRIKKRINDYLWNKDHEMYYDRNESGEWHVRNTIASVWPMVAEVADGRQARAMIRHHLKNPAEFYRPHLFPTLAASDPVYDGRGHYWRGGVWAPTNFAAIKGIERHDPAFAFEAAVNHVDQMSRVYRDFDPAAYPNKMPKLTEPNVPRNGNGIHQIWESYSPDTSAPGTRWDGSLLVRQKFCGWSGLGPVALLIENILGFEADAPANTLVWRVRLKERHGIHRMALGKNRISLVADERKNSGEALVVRGEATRPFRLKIFLDDDPRPAFDREIIPLPLFEIFIPPKSK